MNNLILMRGDTHNLKFQRLDNEGNPILSKAEKIYFTVKIRPYASDFVLQKTIENMTFDSNGFYHFTIEPSDTDSLEPWTYVYDVEIIDGEYKQTISTGSVKIIADVTIPANEV